MSNQIQRNIIVPIEFIEAGFFWRWEWGSGVGTSPLGEGIRDQFSDVQFSFGKVMFAKSPKITGPLFQYNSGKTTQSKKFERKSLNRIKYKEKCQIQRKIYVNSIERELQKWRS